MALWVLLKGILGGALGGAFKLLTEYPKQLALVVVIGVASYFSYNWAYDRGYSVGVKASDEVQAKKIKALGEEVTAKADEIKGLNELIAKVNKERDDLNAKVAELEIDSKQEAANNKRRTEALQVELKKARGDYAASVQDANTWKSLADKRQVLLVEQEGKKIEVRTQNGKVVCDQFYDEHTKIINTMVKSGNKQLESKK